MRREPLTRRVLAVAALLFGAVLATPGIATAAPEYPAAPSNGTVSSSAVAPGGSVTFTGRGFLAGESVDVTVEYAPAAGQSSASAPTALGTTTATTSGAFSFTATLTKAGVATLNAVGATSGNTVTAVVHVQGAAAGSAPSGTKLPVTGTSSLAPLAIGGAALLLAGLAFVGFTVVRRRNAASV